MAEYAYNPAQSVNAGAPVILNTVIPCNKGFVYHGWSAFVGSNCS